MFATSVIEDGSVEELLQLYHMMAPFVCAVGIISYDIPNRLHFVLLHENNLFAHLKCRLITVCAMGNGPHHTKNTQQV